MIDKRRNKRLDINVTLQINNLILDDAKDGLTCVEVNVFNISKAGMGFTCDFDLPQESFYDADVELWTKDKIHTVLKVVRKRKEDSIWEYGCVFLGLSEMDAYRIEVYQLQLENKGR